MNKEQLKEINETYKWIKVSKYKEVTEINENYIKLLEHHISETKFLIEQCRELATELLELQDLKEFLNKKIPDTDKHTGKKRTLINKVWQIAANYKSGIYTKK